MRRAAAFFRFARMPKWSQSSLLAGVSALSLLACGAREPAAAEPLPEAPPSAETRWVHPVSARDSSWLEAPARVISSPNDTAQVSAPLSARVVHVRVHPGQRVAAGEAMVDVLMPELLKAAGALRAAELRLESWQTRRAIIAPLVEKRLAQVAELSDIDANIAMARGDMQAARASLRVAGEPDRRVAALIDGSGTVSLRAPFAGVVVAVDAKVGEVREPLGRALVELVAEDADMRIEARFMATPPKGARFVWVEPTRELPLVLERLSPHADERDGSRSGWLHAADEGAELVAGTLGRVRIVAETDWVVVTARALREQDGKVSVERKTREGSQAVPVHVVQRSATEALVTGLALDAQIAADVSAIQERRP